MCTMGAGDLDMPPSRASITAAPAFLSHPNTEATELPSERNVIWIRFALSRKPVNNLILLLHDGWRRGKPGSFLFGVNCYYAPEFVEHS
jgi:hypothetical protein